MENVRANPVEGISPHIRIIVGVNVKHIHVHMIVH